MVETLWWSRDVWTLAAEQLVSPSCAERPAPANVRGVYTVQLVLPELPTFTTTNNILSECLALEAECVTTSRATREASSSSLFIIRSLFFSGAFIFSLLFSPPPF